MIKKIMILGASILQVPGIVKAKELGHFVIAVDMDKNAVGFGYADLGLVISTIDIAGVLAAAQKHQIDGIMTLATDLPIRTVAAVSKSMHIVGIDEETAFKATNKAAMRQCLKENNVPIPAFHAIYTYEELRRVADSFHDTFIVKPADNSGSRGVFLVDDTSDEKLISHAFEYSKSFSHSGQVVVEEYMSGKEVSVETFSINGNVHIIQITDKLTTGAPHFVEIGHSQPSMLETQIQDDIKKVAKDAINAIGIKTGPSHVEIKVTENGPKIVELGARLGGGCITTHLVPFSTGVNMVENCIKIALNEPVDLRAKFNKGSAIRFFNTKSGIVRRIDGIEEASAMAGIKEISLTKSVGDRTTDLENGSDRIGFVIAQGVSAHDALDKVQRALKQVMIEIH